MDLRDVRLTDRYDLTKSPVLVSGIQALVRATLMQRERDRAAGLNTAGYVTGYRGSPLGAVDVTFTQAAKYLEPAQVRFQPGLNEDLAATALWGSQQAELRGEGRHDGVFGLFYAKGPGIDRSGDVFRHANFAGSSKHGGVLVAMGDDHTCESSTTCHQTELALMDVMMPILSPAGVPELIDYMLIGWAMSRYSGLWVGIKSMKDTVEATAVIDGDPHRLQIALPTDFAMPEGGLNIRLGDTPQEQEARLHDYKRFAAQAFARANRLDRRVHGQRGARIGIVASGKTWLDVRHAMEMLGLDDAACRALGLTTYKVGMVWPLEMTALREWAEGLDLIVVVEEKRAVIETQLKEVLYNAASRPRVVGWKDEAGEVLFSVKMDLNPAGIARSLGRVLGAEGIHHPPMDEGLARIARLAEEGNAPQLAERKPWFCAGCPHNSSTVIPEGSRAYAGIGCHYMVQWMDRETLGFTHMGGEGANWIGEAPFSKRGHVFQNLGDGTYNHSGIMAIRAAVDAGVTMTYKILYNDAVAMTGGQRHEGGLKPRQIAEEVMAAGVKRLVAVVDEKEGTPDLPPRVQVHPRENLMAVQRELAEVPGVTAILYVQTCAAEKRRRRKRGTFPDPDRRVFINPAVCEGCGDCGVQSNCVAILPKETPFGRKRQIDQSACNKDFSCLKGFCPSFVTVEGAKPKARAASDFALPDLPEPALPVMRGPWNMLITGVGGTGVVTVGALLTMAAHLEGKGASEMQMAGLAQKGGAVSIHTRIAPRPEDITSVRVAAGEADAVIGGDLVVTAAPKTMQAMERGRTRVLCNSAEIVTGDFTHDTEFRIPSSGLRLQLERRVGAEALTMVDAQRLSEVMLGDAIFANVLLLGAAWQAGMVPLSREAIHKAIELNGAGVEGNLRAFAIGRWAVAFPADARAAIDGKADTPETPEQKIARRADFLVGYQNARLKRRYLRLVEAAQAAEQKAGAEGFAEALAEGYFKLMVYKDEYEVARLHAETLEAELADAFDDVKRVTFHMAPPILGRKDKEGRPVKSEFGPWMLKALRLLRRGKALRGTPFDPFGWSAERRAERRAIRDYAKLMGEVMAGLTPENAETAIALARLPLKVRGFGHVKQAAAARAAEEQAALMAQFRSGGPAPMAQAAE
ncbi:indolepyruvate ferredoxin oxidoreductase family protein [Limibaculum sp. FT325]|uniref:indolepyruvate ferredoxin oxidoreductase family protein n=1 Tax=Thermohalobaculum sediminis TaxID=2939436 RepID=UPI0020BDD43E|nr:indolepyruvate ferredoxin oxidoreductase family protein [Limibaculum sediminis]MCL5777877.1 indolepyruvate ferredoxin oxidoreductase family protein [Limibaculum sediminis]